MDDLISRQAAIDAVYERIKQIGYEHNASVLSIRQAIRDMPSAQPEIIRCRDCKHRILNENYGKRGYMKNLKAMCELDTGDPFELGRNAEDDDWFCGDAERRTDE